MVTIVAKIVAKKKGNIVAKIFGKNSIQGTEKYTSGTPFILHGYMTQHTHILLQTYHSAVEVLNLNRSHHSIIDTFLIMAPPPKCFPCAT